LHTDVKSLVRSDAGEPDTLACGMGRFASHTSRKRLTELQRKLHNDGKYDRSFDVSNLGQYKRQW